MCVSYTAALRHIKYVGEVARLTLQAARVRNLETDRWVRDQPRMERPRQVSGCQTAAHSAMADGDRHQQSSTNQFAAQRHSHGLVCAQLFSKALVSRRVDRRPRQCGLGCRRPPPPTFNARATFPCSVRGETARLHLPSTRPAAYSATSELRHANHAAPSLQCEDPPKRATLQPPKECVSEQSCCPWSVCPITVSGMPRELADRVCSGG